MNKYLKEVISFLVIIVLVLLFKRYIMMPVKVSGASMRDTLWNRDIMLLSRFSNFFGDYNRFDIVVVDNNNSYLIKRIIGLPTEEVEVLDNKLYINGKYVEETFLRENTETKDFKVVVPKDSYFLMGDNRELSYDSRELGSISKDKIMGKTSLVIFPFKRFGFKS